ncbi:MAG: hypothetical protein ACXVPR_10250 [Actinomycetota bacterium]
MTRKIGRLAIPALVALGLLIPAPAALAAPGSGSAVSTFQLTCDGVLSTLTVGGGPWSAAHVAETGKVFVPTATHAVLQDPTTGEIVFQQDDFKGAPKPSTTTCSETFEMDGLIATFVVEGTMH